ncbi:hypothetical protein BDZ97DRAFT_1857811 [Flammula alnicola]|nr:hypothetical protein BDZ97DRAFT_1857811 [Flammula alnicola]
MRVSFVVLSVLSVIASSSAAALESRDYYYYPQCYYSCREKYSYSTYGCSSYDDYKCLCSNSGWSDSLHTCSKSYCQSDDYSKSKESIYYYCKKYGYSLSGW